MTVETISASLRRWNRVLDDEASKMTLGWRAISTPLALLLLAIGMVAPGRVLASCAPLDLSSIPRTSATAVFVGTVVREQAAHVFLRVDSWFLGPDPVESAEVIGGRDPAVITSADWTPRIGERYLVVADRAAGEGFITRQCQQVAVDQAVLQEAVSVFGAPRQPLGEAGTPQASSPPVSSSPSGRASANGVPTAPNERSGDGQVVPFAIAAAAAVLLTGGVAWAIRRRRPGR